MFDSKESSPGLEESVRRVGCRCLITRAVLGGGVGPGGGYPLSKAVLAGYPAMQPDQRERSRWGTSAWKEGLRHASTLSRQRWSA